MILKLIEKLIFSFILEALNDMFEACDEEGDGIDRYDLSSASCVKFTNENRWSGLWLPEGVLKHSDYNGDGKVTYREVIKVAEYFG